MTPIERLEIIAALIEPLHAQVFAIHSMGDPLHSHAALADGGELHETVHALIRLLPPRSREATAP